MSERTVGARSRAWARWLLLSLSLPITACREEAVAPSATSSTNERTEQVLAPIGGQRLVMPLRLDDEWAQHARQDIPGFAGYYIDDDGEVVVMGREANAQASAVGYARSRMARLRVPVKGYRFRQVDYDANDLSRWHDSLLPLVGGSVVATDFDEVENRVFVGVLPGTSLSWVQDQMRARGVPSNAYYVKYVTRGSPDTGLTDVVRPTVSGLSINLQYCTLGPVTEYNGARAFITASHCSSTPFGSTGDGWVSGQNSTTWNKTAHEVADRSLAGDVYFATTGHEYTCQLPGCRLSDTNINQYYDSVPSRRGFTARTTWYSTDGASSGSFTIDPDDPTFNIYSKLQFTDMIVGLPASKVGAASGWTRGTIRQTCVTASFDDPDEILVCQMVASYYRRNGDSGAPVFFDGASPVYHHLGVELMGTHVGNASDFGHADWGVFSTIQGIDQEFGTLPVCDTISGC